MLVEVKEDRESVKILRECIDLQIRKSTDYQNPNSSVKQAMHYRRGIDTIHDMLHQKMLRALSLLESHSSKRAIAPNFESLEDTYKDIINYASFAVTYLRGKMDGQDPGNDIFNRPNLAPAGNTALATAVYMDKLSNTGLEGYSAWSVEDTKPSDSPTDIYKPLVKR